MEPTRRQKEILAYAQDFAAREGRHPSVAEICAGLGFKSKGHAFYHIQRLARTGLLKKDSHGSISSVTPPRPTMKTKRIPLLGLIPASRQREVFAQDDMIDVPDSFVGPGGATFALMIHGDSMIEAGIRHGDIAFIKKQSVANHGDFVAVQINGEATLKKLYKKNNRLEFHPANATMRPITVNATDEVEVIGILTGLYHSFQQK